jgi:hypothetical protein
LGGEIKKKMNKTKKGIVAFLLAAALLISMVGMASANSIKWDLDNNGVMYSGTHTETGSVTITQTNSQVWRAENDAKPAGGVYFPAEIWQGRLTTNEDLAGKYTVDIGYSDAGGTNFNSNGVTGSQTEYKSSQGASLFNIDADGFTVPQNKYLALKVINTGDPSFTVTTTGNSYVVWPGETPVYPYPELPTIILMSTGLLALLGFVVYSRRRNNKK